MRNLLPSQLEELVFVDAHFDDVDGVDGIDGSYDMAISPDGLFLYVAAMNDDAIAIFSRDTGTGELTFVNRIKNGEGVVEGLNGASDETGIGLFEIYVLDNR